MECNNERVVHPKHYNEHPSGVECIDIIRHYPCDIANAIKYLWREGLKDEEGYDSDEKAVEDCNKAIFYIKDYIENILGGVCKYELKQNKQ